MVSIGSRLGEGGTWPQVLIPPSNRSSMSIAMQQNSVF
mgnify:CR=1 FL=1